MTVSPTATLLSAVIDLHCVERMRRLCVDAQQDRVEGADRSLSHLAAGETVILLHPPLPLVGLSTIGVLGFRG